MGRTSGIILSMVTVAALVSGCSGLNAYRDVDLSRDLSPQDAERYEKEWQTVKEGEGAGVIENTNMWPLGILFYWDKGKVMRMGAHQPEYHVVSTKGVGPFSMFYVSETHSTYNGTGQLMSTMTTSSVLWGHLAMFHSTESVLPDGRRQEMRSSHLLHHLINLHTVDGHSRFSFLSSPNVLGGDSIEAGGSHSGH